LGDIVLRNAGTLAKSRMKRKISFYTSTGKKKILCRGLASASDLAQGIATTLGAVRKQFPRGELGERLRGEGWNLLDYTIQFGGEGSEIMSFGVSWTDLTDRTNSTIAQRDRLTVTNTSTWR
jgi:hypothetical protein